MKDGIGRVLRFEAEDRIFHQGDGTSGLFWCISGSVELRRMTEAGAVVVMHRCSKAETFAEASLFADHYHCDAVATSATQVVKIDKKSMLAAMAESPAFAAAVAARFARDVQSARRQVELLSVASAKERVHLALADGLLADSVMALSRRIGLTHEATYRALAALVCDGTAEKTGRGRYELIAGSR